MLINCNKNIALKSLKINLLCQPNAPERAIVLMTSLSVRLVDKLKFSFENILNPSVLLTVMSHLEHLMTHVTLHHLFTTRGVLFVINVVF